MFDWVRRQRASGFDATVTIGGGGRSFGGQALPPQREDVFKVHLKTDQMRDVAVLEHIDEAGTIWVCAGGGATLGALSETAAAFAGGQYLPPSVPTSPDITLAGALAAHTHSRSTSAGEGYVLKGVRSFNLITPDKGVIHCSPDAETELARDLFYAAPGSFGAFGVISDVEMKLQQVPPQARVRTEVLHKSHELESFLHQFGTLARETLNEGIWNQGVYALLFGDPSKGRGVVLGSRTDTDEESRSLPEMPLYADRPRRNAYMQGLGHKFPRIANRATERTFKEGARFSNEVYPYVYFQNSHDQAHDILKAPLAAPLRALKLVDPDLPVVHQCWVVPEAKLGGFIGGVGKVLREDFQDVLPMIELQDILLLPPAKATLSPLSEDNPRLKDGGYAYTISTVAPDKGGPKTERVRAFYRAVSDVAERSPGSVHLLKESNCDDELLRRLYEPQLKKILQLKAKTDASGIISSTLLDRLTTPAPSSETVPV